MEGQPFNEELNLSGVAFIDSPADLIIQNEPGVDWTRYINTKYIPIPDTHASVRLEMVANENLLENEFPEGQSKVDEGFLFDGNTFTKKSVFDLWKEGNWQVSIKIGGLEPQPNLNLEGILSTSTSPERLSGKVREGNDRSAKEPMDRQHGYVEFGISEDGEIIYLWAKADFEILKNLRFSLKGSYSNDRTEV